MAIREDFGLDFAKMRVLLVEDNDFALNLAKSALAELGFQTVIVARDGREAWRTLENFPHFQLIISDWNMPHLNGLELLKMARERWPAIPFVMLTSNDTLEHVGEAHRNGVFAYIVKPFSLAGMRKQIILAIRKRLAQGGEAADDDDEVFLKALSHIDAFAEDARAFVPEAMKPEVERFEDAVETLVLSPGRKVRNMQRLDEVINDLKLSVAADRKIHNPVQTIADQLRTFVAGLDVPSAVELEIIKLHVETIRTLTSDIQHKVSAEHIKALMDALAMAIGKTAA